MSNLILDACAFVFDIEARDISKFTYPNGSPMSVRSARMEGLIKTNKAQLIVNEKSGFQRLQSIGGGSTYFTAGSKVKSRFL